MQNVVPVDFLRDVNKCVQSNLFGQNYIVGIYNGFEFHFDLVPKHDICILLGPDLLCPQQYSYHK